MQKKLNLGILLYTLFLVVSHHGLIASSPAKKATVRETKDRRNELFKAISNGDINLVKTLVARNDFDINSEDHVHGQTALLFAIRHTKTPDKTPNALNIIEEVLKYPGLNIDLNVPYIPLLYAADTDKPSVVALLLKYGADYNQTNARGMNLQNFAKENPEIMEVYKTFLMEKIGALEKSAASIHNKTLSK